MEDWDFLGLQIYSWREGAKRLSSMQRGKSHNKDSDGILEHRALSSSSKDSQRCFSVFLKKLDPGPTSAPPFPIWSLSHAPYSTVGPQLHPRPCGLPDPKSFPSFPLSYSSFFSFFSCTFFLLRNLVEGKGIPSLLRMGFPHPAPTKWMVSFWRSRKHVGAGTGEMRGSRAAPMSPIPPSSCLITVTIQS